MAKSGAAKPGELSSKSINKSIRLFGGRLRGRVRFIVGPANSVVAAGKGGIYVTDGSGRVILDITRAGTRPVEPGRGFGAVRPPTVEELALLSTFSR